MSQIGNVGVKKNSGAIVGIQPSIDFNEGANITLTIVNDPLSHDVSVTIAAGAVAPGADQDTFYPAPNPDNFKGHYATMTLANDQDTIIRQTFYLPANYTGDWGADMIIIPNAGNNVRWGVDTHMGQVCADEQYDTHVGAVALNNQAVTADEIECLDITGALALGAANDLVGLEFLRNGENAGDTSEDIVHYVGVILRAPPPE